MIVHKSDPWSSVRKGIVKDLLGEDRKMLENFSTTLGS